MSEEPKKLYRARDERMIAGVCGGLGKYFNVDPTVLRVLFVATAIFGIGGGILVYILMMIIVPEEPR
jgi:phage shock protein C